MFPICILSLLLLSKFANSYPHFDDVVCVDAAGFYTDNSTYKINLNYLLLNLITETRIYSPPTFYSSVSGSDSPNSAVHGFYYCRGYVQPRDCQDCVESAAAKVMASCPVQMEAVVWYEECMLRYANRVMSSQEEEDPWIWQRQSSASKSNSDSGINLKTTLTITLSATLSATIAVSVAFKLHMKGKMKVKITDPVTVKSKDPKPEKTETGTQTGDGGGGCPDGNDKPCPGGSECSKFHPGSCQELLECQPMFPHPDMWTCPFPEQVMNWHLHHYC